MKILTANKGHLALDAIIGIIIISLAIFTLTRSTIFFSNIQTTNNQEFKSANIISNYLESLYEEDLWRTETIEHKDIEFSKEHNETNYSTEQLKITVKEKDFILERRIPHE